MPSPAAAAVLDHLDRDRPAVLERLCRFLAIPSVSTDPAYAPQVRAAAAHVTASLADMGLSAQTVATPGHPVVLAEAPADRVADPAAPHVLFYGHYDVQPVEPRDPANPWVSEPFDPAVRDGHVYARGAVDDKGPVWCFLEALRAWLHVHRRLPGPVTVLLEGEEECGSRSLPAFLQAHRDRLTQAQVVLISDTGMWDAATPAITYGLRGLLYFDLQLHQAKIDCHSGMYGGTFANPATMLTQVLGRLFDANHRLTIPGFYDDVLPVSDEERRQWDRIGFDERRHCLDALGVRQPFGEAGYTTLERRWARPACDINGLYGGYGGAGAKTVLPAYAGAKVSFRLAPRQSPDRIAEAFEQWLRAHDVHGCRWQITNLGGADPVVTPTDSPYIRAARQACQAVFGKEPLLIREGATIPVVAQFKNLLGLDSVMLGFDLAEDNIHAPNERFGLDRFHAGCRTHAVLLETLAAARRDG